jgi:hypothetical protein
MENPTAGIEPIVSQCHLQVGIGTSFFRLCSAVQASVSPSIEDAGPVAIVGISLEFDPVAAIGNDHVYRSI